MRAKARLKRVVGLPCSLGTGPWWRVPGGFASSPGLPFVTYVHIGCCFVGCLTCQTFGKPNHTSEREKRERRTNKTNCVANRPSTLTRDDNGWRWPVDPGHRWAMANGVFNETASSSRSKACCHARAFHHFAHLNWNSKQLVTFDALTIALRITRIRE